MKRWSLSAVMTLGLFATSALAQRGRERPFPHERHERLFPLCESCHAGIPTGDAAASMPTEASCRECHNGTDARVVTWRRPVKGQGLLRFSHPEHAREVDSTGKACATCHGTSGQSRMTVSRAQPPSCLGCHTHRASDHLGDDNRCSTCHVPLTAATALSAERIMALPKPPSHGRQDFVATHQPGTPLASASCAICHARESCARCHVNASTQPIIVALASDTRVAGLVAGRAPSWPLPADHRDKEFNRAHGGIARANAKRCGTCHARPACTTCHLGGGAIDVTSKLPQPGPGAAQGVMLRLRPARLRATTPTLVPQDTSRPRPVQVHNANFRTNHAAQAATASLSCAGCHERRFCADCHAAEVPRRFHRANFSQSHGAESWGRETDCASCHNAQVFCRSCHRESGLAAKGRLDAAYHTAQPLWLLQHGRAARQGLQSCTTCHAQRDCLTCHSTLGWGVSPHGPGFRAERLASRNATQCLMCHLQVPGRR